MYTPQIGNMGQMGQMNPMGHMGHPMNQQMGQMPRMNPMMMGQNMTSAPVLNPEGVLFVGNLDPKVNEYQLFEMFSKISKPQCVRLMRDAYTGESRRFAFVSYLVKDDAEKARKQLNYSRLFEREIRICFKRARTDFKATANIFVKNLERDVTTRQLEEQTKEFGQILSCIVRLDEAGASLGYGYVQFESEESAKKAIDALHNKDLFGSIWSVSEFVPRKNRALAQKKNVYVKNFPASWDKAKVEGELDTLFNAHGTVTCKGAYEYRNTEGQARFYAFVAYENVEAAEKAIEALNGLELEGKVAEEEALYVDYAQSKNQRKEILKKKYLNSQSETNLFIKSLVEDVTEEQLRTIFSKWGIVTSICVKSAQKAISKNLKFAFVNYSKTEEAAVAFTEAKKDEEVKSLIDSSHFSNIDFIYFAQSKHMRMQYLRMKQKNKQALQMNWMSMMGGYGMYGNQRNKFQGGRGRGRNTGQNGPGSASSGNGTFNPMMADTAGFMGGQPNMNQMGLNFDPMQMMPYGGFGMNNPNSFSTKNNQNSAYTGSNNPGSTHSGQHNSVNNVTGIEGSNSSFLNSVNKTINADPVQVDAEIGVEWLKENKKEFMAKSQELQKNILGNLMFGRVQKSAQADEESVPKITGMLIDLEILEYEEIIDILENDESLTERISEAIEVMNDTN